MKLFCFKYIVFLTLILFITVSADSAVALSDDLTACQELAKEAGYDDPSKFIMYLLLYITKNEKYCEFDKRDAFEEWPDEILSDTMIYQVWPYCVAKYGYVKHGRTNDWEKVGFKIRRENYRYDHIMYGCVASRSRTISMFKDKSVDECAKICNTMDDCLGFEYGVDYGGRGMSKPRDCHPQSSANTHRCNGRHFNLDFYKKVKINYQYERIMKGCVKDKNIKLFKDKSVDECAKICNTMDDCLGFEYGVDYGVSGKYKPRDCQPQSSANTHQCNGGHYNLDFYKRVILPEEVGDQTGADLFPYNQKAGRDTKFARRAAAKRIAKSCGGFGWIGTHIPAMLGALDYVSGYGDVGRKKKQAAQEFFGETTSGSNWEQFTAVFQAFKNGADNPTRVLKVPAIQDMMDKVHVPEGKQEEFKDNAVSVSAIGEVDWD